jgi:NitT/TauT family transport system ATP-binding protein
MIGSQRFPVSAALSTERGEGSPGRGVVMEGVTKRFRSRDVVTTAVEDVSLNIEPGQFVTLIGPSGCGKSTLLRIAAGLTDADEGTVSVFGDSVRVACKRKHIGLVSQTPALLPWRTVLDNVRLPLQLNRKARGPSSSHGDEAPSDPEAILAAFGLSGDVLSRRPAQLSGGMQQRVAIARAFTFRPSVLLMDEPFSALDELTREVLRHELLAFCQRERTTVLFVTHSVTEAVLLSDVIVVMSAGPGRVQAVVPVDIPRPRGDSVEFGEDFHRIENSVHLFLRSGWRK